MSTNCNPSCSPIQFCSPPDFATDFPDLIGPQGPSGGPGTQFENIAEMTAYDATTLAPNQQLWVGGYVTMGDGWGGRFWWDDTSVETPNLGTIFAPDAGGVGRFKRFFRYDAIYVDYFGPFYTDVQLNAAGALLDPAIGGTIIAGPHTYDVTNNVNYNGINNLRFVGQGQGITILDSSAHTDIGTTPNANGFWGTLSVGSDPTQYTSNIYLADFTVKASNSTLVPLKQKGLLFQCTEKLTVERVEFDGCYRECLIGFGAESTPAGSAFEPRHIRVENCRFVNLAAHAAFQVFSFAYDIVLIGNNVEDCYLGFFSFGAQTIMQGNTFLRVAQNAIYMGEAYDYSTGRTMGASVVSGNTIEGLGYGYAVAAGQVWGIRTTGGRSLYADKRTDVGVVIANNSIIYGALSSVSAPGSTYIAISIIGSVKVSDNYIAGAPVTVTSQAMNIAPGLVPVGAVTSGDSHVFLDNNTIDSILLASPFADFYQGIYVEADSTIRLYLTGNKVMAGTFTAFQTNAGGGGYPFFSLNGDIFNDVFSVEGQWLDAFNAQNTTGTLDNVPLYGSSDTTVYTGISEDLMGVDWATATPSVKGMRVLYSDSASAGTVTNFLNGVTGQVITLISRNSNWKVQNNADILLSGAADFTAGNKDTITLIRFVDKWYEIGRSVNH